MQDGYEIVVVDNSVCKLTADEFARSYNGTRIMFVHTTIIGLSNARNIGAEAATGDIVAYLDDDAVAEPHWVRGIVEAFRSNGAQTGVVGGPVRPIWSAPPPSWMDESFLEIFAIIDRGPHMRVLDATEWLAGCNIAFARDALLAAGGFDTGLGRIGGSLLSNEETAVCDRIRKLGRDVIYAPDVVVGHRVPPARATVPYVRRRVAWQAVSDALAYPQRSRDHAASTAGWGILGRTLKAMRFYRLMKQRPGSMTRKDYDFVYDLVTRLVAEEVR